MLYLLDAGRPVLCTIIFLWFFLLFTVAVTFETGHDFTRHMKRNYICRFLVVAALRQSHFSVLCY